MDPIWRHTKEYVSLSGKFRHHRTKTLLYAAEEYLYAEVPIAASTIYVFKYWYSVIIAEDIYCIIRYALKIYMHECLLCVVVYNALYLRVSVGGFDVS